MGPAACRHRHPVRARRSSLSASPCHPRMPGAYSLCKALPGRTLPQAARDISHRMASRSPDCPISARKKLATNRHGLDMRHAHSCIRTYLAFPGLSGMARFQSETRMLCIKHALAHQAHHRFRAVHGISLCGRHAIFQMTRLLRPLAAIRLAAWAIAYAQANFSSAQRLHPQNKSRCGV